MTAQVVRLKVDGWGGGNNTIFFLDVFVFHDFLQMFICKPKHNIDGVLFAVCLILSSN